jgi:DNA topoisomerase IB
VPRLRTVSPRDPGWTRRRAGKGFVYLNEFGQPLAAEDVLRCKQLVIPPAWRQVWICPSPNGHIQAVGTDDAGRRQYLYHPYWRLKRDQSKHDRVLTVAARLPTARRRVIKHLQMEGMPYERAMAAAFRLLDLGFFRIGGEAYAEANNSYGLATIHKEHVSIQGRTVVFDYLAKSGQERYVALADNLVRAAVRDLLSRRDSGPELLAYEDSTGWHDINSTEINTYIKGVVGGEVSAKDFRTWHGTVIAEVSLAGAVEKSRSVSARKRAVSSAMKEVSKYLGNTPAVARKS